MKVLIKTHNASNVRVSQIPGLYVLLPGKFLSAHGPTQYNAVISYIIKYMYTSPLVMFRDHINKTRFYTAYIVNPGSHKQLPSNL